MHANNETGVIQPVQEASLIVKSTSPKCLFHTDATQSVGKIGIDLQSLKHVDLLSLSAHKFHGPKGIGALFNRSGTNLENWMHGGSQQEGRRAGTENPAFAAGLAKAIDLLGTNRNIATRGELSSKLRDRLESGLEAIAPKINVLGKAAHRLANTSLMLFSDTEGEMLVHQLFDYGIIASTGAACSNGSDRPSHVVTSMGIDYSHARNTLRISLSDETIESEIDRCILVLQSILTTK